MAKSNFVRKIIAALLFSLTLEALLNQGESFDPSTHISTDGMAPGKLFFEVFQVLKYYCCQCFQPINLS